MTPEPTPWSRRSDGVVERLQTILEVVRGTSLDLDDYAPARHGPLVSFEPPTGMAEVDRYWVDAPFAFVWIGNAVDGGEYRYVVAEPTLDEWESKLFDTLIDDLRETLIHRRSVDDASSARVLESELIAQLERYGVRVGAPAIYRLLYHLVRRFQGYGRIDPILKDPNVEDISCDGSGKPVFVYHRDYTDVRTNVTFPGTELDDFVVRLAQRAGRNISIGDPITHAMLPDGSRTELALGEEVTPHGSAFTIRKFATEPMTPVRLIDHGTFSRAQMAYLWLAIQHNKSLLFAGGTAAGKTTSMNAVSMFIPPRSKVVTIEDTPEISLSHENWLSAVTREDIGEEEDIDMYDLLRSALRHRPEYLIVGEVRGREAMTLFQAMNTGHTTYSTMHADSIQTVINRLENEPINVPRSMIQSLDILAVQVMSHRRGERVRRTRAISEVLEVDQRTGDLDYQTVFRWDAPADEFESRLGGSAVVAEIRDELGWSEARMERELRDRRRVLAYASQQGYTDYQAFTDLVNEYYSDKQRVMARVEDSAIGEPAVEQP